MLTLIFFLVHFVRTKSRTSDAPILASRPLREACARATTLRAPVTTCARISAVRAGGKVAALRLRGRGTCLRVRNVIRAEGTGRHARVIVETVVAI